MRRLLLYLYMVAMMGVDLSFAQPGKLVQTQDELVYLGQKIVVLREQLTRTQDKQNDVEQGLAQQDKKISEVIRQLNEVALRTKAKQTEIKRLTEQDTKLSLQMILQQRALSEFMRVRYRLGKELAIKGLFSLDSPHQVSRWIVFCQYIMASQQQMIRQIQQVQRQLKESHALLRQQLNEQAQLMESLKLKRSQLAQNRTEQLRLRHQLVSDIQNNQQTLSNYQRDKENLAKLLQRLLQEQQPKSLPSSQTFSAVKFNQFSPLGRAHLLTKHWNQGLLYQAAEGTPVTAVKAGKVVFSDWLRGYGLLLIVDHGHGLMTLYGYNQSLFKRQGEQVVAGQQIATVGHSGGRLEDGLYFEVRRFGKVVASALS
jgi:septal ring factor EnvC (AmiA/AmiB activator)